LSGRVDGLQDSALWLLPRVEVAGGRASFQGDSPRVLDDDRFVIVLDTRSGAPEIPPAAAGDHRPRYVVRADALLVLARGRAPRVLPWTALSAAWDPVSVDGPELVARLRDGVPRMVFAVTAFGWALTLGTGTALLGGMVGFYRLAFARGPFVPEARALFAAGCAALLPAYGAGGLVAACGGGTEIVVGIWISVASALFFVASTRLRFDGPIGSGPAPEPAVVTEL
jgi:hypothetical protein